MRAPLALLVLALPLPAMAQTVPVPPPTDGTLLEVSAEGRTVRTPDVATIRAGVVTQGTTAAAALSENAQRMSGVLAALKKAGVAPRDIATAQVGLEPQYRYTEGQAPAITGYQARNSVSVRFRDVARSGVILDALVAQGANQIDGPNLSLDQPDAALDEARTDAVKRARARADLYARAAGLRVARIVSISESGEDRGGSPNPPMPMVRMAAAPRADTQIAAGETDVTVTLSVRFLLQ
ncbi:SIMPL domain-containing protein [Sphingomonas aracearum]|uniref:DUF541 domain-containing protein n=1 Tax=Sphingomonas aracearum TaxID=2283317 RepID=A0A369VV42_9SPHN|nr:SIMPL domain-containing protein [Sphingomonas aracearum]RDE04942.1 DUF541 domain-containing protein [Sphingomonas aracearum]